MYISMGDCAGYEPHALSLFWRTGLVSPGYFPLKSGRMCTANSACRLESSLVWMAAEVEATALAKVTSLPSRHTKWCVRFRAKREHLERFQGLNLESQGQNLTVTVLQVPHSLVGGTLARMVAELEAIAQVASHLIL